MQDDNTKEIGVAHSTLETIDQAAFDWLDSQMNVYVTTNKGFSKVPVKYVAGEKSYQAKKDFMFRDSSGALILPLATMERTSVTKDPAKKGTIQANLPKLPGQKEGVITIARRIKQDKTSNFANSSAKRKYGKINYRTREKEKTVYETVTIPIPVYVEVTYKISLKSEYQQQMNEMVQPFITRPGSRNHFIIEHNKHRYEASLQSDFSISNTTSEMTEKREFETTVELKVLASLIGDSSNQQAPKYAIRENAVEMKITRETTILNPDDIERI